MCRTKGCISYAEIENRIHSPIGPATIEIFNTRQKLVGYMVSRDVGGVRYDVRLCTEACRGALDVAIRRGTMECEIRCSIPLDTAVGSDGGAETMTDVVGVVADVLVHVYVRGFRRVQPLLHGTALGIFADIASA